MKDHAQPPKISEHQFVLSVLKEMFHPVTVEQIAQAARSNGQHVGKPSINRIVRRAARAGKTTVFLDRDPPEFMCLRKNG